MSEIKLNLNITLDGNTVSANVIDLDKEMYHDDFEEHEEQEELLFKLEPVDTEEEERKKKERIKEAERKKALKEYQPTFEEIWYTGYKKHTGNVETGIYQKKNSEADLNKLNAVREAIETGEMGWGVDDLKKFSKAHALRLYVELVAKNRQSQLDKMIATRPNNYETITTIKDFQELLEQLRYESLLGVDTETTGLDYIDENHIVGISLSLNIADRHVYIPYGHTTGEKQLHKSIVLEGLKPVLENPKYKAVYHNAKFDLHMFLKEGINAKRSFHFCTMVGFSLLNENETSFALKNLATKYGQYIGFEDKSATFEELFGKNCKFNTVELQYASVYAIKDTHLTLELYKFIQSQFDRMPQLREYYNNIERPITLISIDMEQKGFLIDLEFASEYGKELQEEIDQLEIELKIHFGEINFNSPIQLAEVIYDKWGVEGSSRSTDAKTLERLSKQYKGAEVLLKYRDLNKLLSTYVIPLPDKVAKRDGRLHGRFNQSGTVTGRFSSNDPNLQNLPKKARHLVKASDGKLIIGIDFSQIEPRTLASMSGDSKFSAPYLTDRDLYSEIASNVFKVPISECGDKSIYRKQAKVILLGVTYGMSDRSLAEMLKIPVAEASKFIKDFFEAYPDVTKFMEELNNNADTLGYVETLFKRKRRFIGHVETAKQYHAVCKSVKEKFGEVPTDIWGSKLPRKVKQVLWNVAGPYGRVKRMSVNSVIQGSATEIMKIAMIKLDEYLKAKGPEWSMIATVHDEVLMEVPETITLQEIEELEAIMANAVQLKVPVKVDTDIQKVWGKSISKAEWVANGYKIA